MATQMRKIGLFIPTFNCADDFSKLLNSLKELNLTYLSGLVVIDNSSLTHEADSIKKETYGFNLIPAHYIKNPQNKGLGGSHYEAFNYFLKNQYSHMIVLHGDNQADLGDLLDQPWLQWLGDFDALLGSRFMKGSRLTNYSRLRLVTNKIFNGIFSVLTSTPTSDLGSGLNVYNLKIFKDVNWDTIPLDLNFNYYLLYTHWAHGHRIRFFPIKWITSHQKSSVRPFQQTIHLMKLASMIFYRKRQNS